MATRRDFLVTASAAAVAALARCNAAAPAAVTAGALAPVVDETTGEPLLRLPPGFRYRTLPWSLDGKRADGSRGAGLPDGMGAFVDPAGRIATLVRNHEVSLAPPLLDAPAYDPRCGGGTTTLRFDLASGEWLSSRASLAGTYRNCAGGPTPWGSWLSCEETLADPSTDRVQRPHGYVFEVPADGQGDPRPLRGLGRFVHEAAAVDPRTGIVYLTEDETRAGLYRFVPREAGLRGAGQLQMLAIEDRPNFRGVWRPGLSLPVAWVDIADPDAVDGSVFRQGQRRGGMRFRRLEGCWCDDGRLYFVSTTGGRAGRGQIWDLDMAEQRLGLLYESPGAGVLNMPDNLIALPGGVLALCEDGGAKWRVWERAAPTPSRLRLLSPSGALATLAENNVVLDGLYGLQGDYRRSEWCGVCRAGDWLFANIQEPGITFALQGPWGDLV